MKNTTTGVTACGKVKCPSGEEHSTGIPYPLCYLNLQHPTKLERKRAKILTHLLFMDDLKLYGRNEKEINSLVHTVRVFSTDIGMDFGIKNCTMMVMKRQAG